MLFDGDKEARDLDEAFDVVIVGSGAAGASVARILADSDLTVAVIEEGPAVRTAEFGDRFFSAMSRLLRDSGSTVARGKAMIPILQGRCLGGSTVINSAIVWRLPEDVWAPWDREYGLGDALPLEAMNRAWDLIEGELGVARPPEAMWGENNRLFHVAKEKLGIKAEAIQRYAKGCKGSARCLTGCPHGAKQSMLVSYLPYAGERGATLFTAAKVDKVEVRGGKAEAVVGHFRNTQTGQRLAPFRIRAKKAVVIAASAIQTPGLLARSGVKNAHLGRHFQGHPGCALLGVFDEPVNMWFGATQGYDADHYRQSRRFKIETIAFPPELILSRMPGVGREWKRNMAEAQHMVGWAVQLRSHGQGRVVDRFFGTDITFNLTPEDMDNLRFGLHLVGELMFAAGARSIIPNIAGLPPRLTSPDQLKLIMNGPSNPGAYSFILSHLFGTARMSPSSGGGVVSTDFSVHGAPNLYVVDSSIFPTNTGVNPQHTIMAAAMVAAERIRDDFL